MKCQEKIAGALEIAYLALDWLLIRFMLSSIEHVQVQPLLLIILINKAVKLEQSIFHKIIMYFLMLEEV
jgi:hypothetical protein